jgi:hypothetical protein
MTIIGFALYFVDGQYMSHVVCIELHSFGECEVWDNLRRLNKVSDKCEMFTSEDFDILFHLHFQLNCDETSSMLTNLSGFNITGATEICRHMKNSEVLWVSTTALRVGASTFTMGPMMFLANRETMTHHRLINLNLINIHAPPPSMI